MRREVGITSSPDVVSYLLRSPEIEDRDEPRPYRPARPEAELQTEGTQVPVGSVKPADEDNSGNQPECDEGQTDDHLAVVVCLDLRIRDAVPRDQPIHQRDLGAIGTDGHDADHNERDQRQLCPLGSPSKWAVGLEPDGLSCGTRP